MEELIMFCKNERGLERIFRIGLGLGLISWGFWISGTYWLSYAIPTYQIPCWEWSNFISHACLVERGFTIAVVGSIPTLTGIIGWCPLKAIFGIK
jgi:hypothetical protein